MISYVPHSEAENGSILYDNMVIPFVDKYPADTKKYKIVGIKPEESEQKNAVYAK